MQKRLMPAALITVALILSLLLPGFNVTAAKSPSRKPQPNKTQPRKPPTKTNKSTPKVQPRTTPKLQSSKPQSLKSQPAKSSPHPMKGFSAQCVGVLDGDTIVVADENYEQVKIRLYGIDAPELKQPFGKEASAEAQSLVFLKKVMIYNQGNDKDGTILAWVFLPTKQGQLCLNRELVRRGYAWWNRVNAPGEMMLGVTEAEAKGNKSGIWSQRSPVAPWEFRAQEAARQTAP